MACLLNIYWEQIELMDFNQILNMQIDIDKGYHAMLAALLLWFNILSVEIFINISVISGQWRILIMGFVPQSSV